MGILETRFWPWLTKTSQHLIKWSSITNRRNEMNAMLKSNKETNKWHEKKREREKFTLAHTLTHKWDCERKQVRVYSEQSNLELSSVTNYIFERRDDCLLKKTHTQIYSNSLCRVDPVARSFSHSFFFSLAPTPTLLVSFSLAQYINVKCFRLNVMWRIAVLMTLLYFWLPFDSIAMSILMMVCWWVADCLNESERVCVCSRAYDKVHCMHDPSPSIISFCSV